MKKIIIFSLLSIVLFSSQVSLAETYPSTCDSMAQAILNATGGCSAIDCNTLSNICEKCCTQNIPQTSTCTSFTYSSWSVCQSNGQKTRTVVSSSPSGCTGGSPLLTWSCTYVAPTETSAISSFESEKEEINSGDSVDLSFSGYGISKYNIYLACPKFSGGLNDGLPAASVMIDEEEYCNQVFEIPNTSDVQELTIFSKYSKPLNLKIRLRAYNTQDQQITYEDLVIIVNPTSSTNIDITGTSDVEASLIPTTPSQTQTTSQSAGSSSLSLMFKHLLLVYFLQHQ